MCMNITAQHVAPEEIMELLDGELSAAEAQAISAHIEDCAECARLAEQLRTTSQALSAWKVAAIPTRLEDSITEVAAKAGSGAEIGNSGLFVRTSFWSWKQWAGLGCGAAVSALLLFAIFLPMRYERRQVAQHRIDGFAAEHTERLDQRTGGDRDRVVTRGSIGRLQKDGAVMGALIGTPESAKALQDVLPPRLEDAPMIARTVALSMMTRDFAASRSSLDAIVARYQGYSAQMNVSTTENSPRSLEASLRIPAPALSSTIRDLKTLGRVERESQSGEEVTRQHEDLVARLKNSRETEQRLREILQQRTGKVTDVLKVEQEIARVRGEIEEMKAEQKALEHRVDFATVELQLTEEYKAHLNPPAPSVSTRVHNAFVAGYQNVSETLLGIVLFFAEFGPAILIWLATLSLPVVAIWRRYRRLSAAV